MKHQIFPIEEIINRFLAFLYFESKTADYQILASLLGHSFSQFILQGLKDLGHKISEKDLASAVQGIEVANLPCLGQSGHRCLLANADYRKGGDHDGF